MKKYIHNLRFFFIYINRYYNFILQETHGRTLKLNSRLIEYYLCDDYEEYVENFDCLKTPTDKKNDPKALHAPSTPHYGPTGSTLNYKPEPPNNNLNQKGKDAQKNPTKMEKSNTKQKTHEKPKELEANQNPKEPDAKLTPKEPDANQNSKETKPDKNSKQYKTSIESDEISDSESDSEER